MRQKIVSTIIAAALTVGGVVTMTTPANAADCEIFVWQSDTAPNFGAVTNKTCSNSVRAGIAIRNPATGTIENGWGPLVSKSNTSKTGTVTASWIISRLYRTY